MKFTKYIVQLQQNEKTILLNPATGGIIRVTNDVYNKINNNSVDEFTCEEKQFLIKTGFLVEEDYDDRILEEIEKNNLSSSFNLVFMTSENCNFKCNYCYENHSNNHIGDDVYDDVINLAKKSSKENLMVNWFGGEPLLEINHIEYFMNKVFELNHFNVIKSSIITNGYLLSPENFHRLINVNVNIFQITLDGLKEEHDTNRVLRNGKGTFDKIIANIKYIKESMVDFTVYLRYNFNENSKLLEYIDYIYELIGNDQRFILDFHTIGDWQSTYNGVPNAHKNCVIVSAMKKAYQLGMRVRAAEEDICPTGHLCSAKMSDAIIINYKREVMKCTIMLDWDKNIIGKLNSDGTITYNENLLFWQKNVWQDKCSSCNVRPLCLNKYCPHIDYKTCKKQKEQMAIDALKVKYE